MIHKTMRSILSVLLAVLLLVTSVPLTPAFAGDGGAVSPQSESAEGPFAGGTGTKDNPYKIATADDLLEFADKVNDDSGNYTDIDAELTADIDLSEICGENIGGQSVSWTPIGSISRPYSGTFNGAGHTISGLYIKSSDNDQGLFGRVNGGTVQNLTVSGSVSGGWYVGGVVGYNNSGTVTGCTFSGSGSVSGGGYVGGVVGYSSGGISASASVTNCYNTGEVSGGEYVGGVVGLNSGTVENCYNTGTVTGTNDYVGGVVGWNSRNVTNCYNTDSITVTGSGGRVGGVVGYNSRNVTNCYNTGTVTGPDSGNSNKVGGVVGWNDSGTVKNCYNTGSVSGSYVGGVVGDNSGTVTGCYFLKQDPEIPGIGNDEDAEGAAVVDNLADQKQFEGWDFTDIWRISQSLGFPVLQDNAQDGLPPGLGTEASPYEISTATQLENFRDLVNDENDQTADPDAHAKLMNDIDLSSVCGESLNSGTSWNPIGTSEENAYTGTFDGNGKTISGLYINDSTADYQGLFGFVGRSGKVQNLSVSGSVSGDISGGVVGGERRHRQKLLQHRQHQRQQQRRRCGV